MKILGLICVLFAIAIVAFLIFVRLVPDRVAQVHLDPMLDGATSPNSVAMRPSDALVYATTPEALFDTTKAYLVERLGAVEVANGPDPLHASFTIRSRVLRYPDDVSIKVVAVDGGVGLAIYSRARLAGYDWGVNRARVDGLVAHLAARFPSDS